jgi:hypothetical protein
MNTERKEAEMLLARLVKNMAIPSHKTKDVRWLHTNLKQRNEEHPRFKEAEEHLNFMYAKGWY